MTISVSGSEITFTTTSSNRATARSEVTTAEPTGLVTFAFEVQRNPLVIRVGTTAGGQEVVSDLVYEPGTHTISFTPEASPYYVEFSLFNVGKAVLKNFARVASGDFSLPMPWTGNFHLLRLHQSLNVIYAAHPAFEPRVIERRGDTSWTNRYLRPDDGPFDLLNATDIRLTPSAQTGEVTITASAPAFAAQDAGSLLRLTQSGQYEASSFTTTDDATESIRVSGVDTSRVFNYSISGTFSATIWLERSIGNEFNWEVVQAFTTAASGSFDDELDNQIIFYRLRSVSHASGTADVSLTYSQGVTDGVARIVSVEADNEVIADVVEPFSRLTETALWYRGAWSARNGWPSAVGMYDGRLSLVRDDQYWLSSPDLFESFRIGAEEDAAINRSLTGRMNAAQWIKGVRHLLVGTTGSEHIITAGDLNEILTPATTFSRGLKARGSVSADACIIDDYVAFISRSGQRIYLMADAGGGRYELIDLTRLHPEVGGPSGFKELAFQYEPEPRLWAVRHDGEIAVLLLDQSERLMGWSRMTTPGGLFRSVCVLPTTNEDQVFFLIDRPELKTGEEWFIERLAPEAFTHTKYAQRLHSAVVYDGAATTTLTGLGHLEGEEVYTWGDGVQYGPFTVSSESITLPHAVSYAVTGLLSIGRYKSPRLDWGAQAGTALTRHKQVKGLGLMVRDTPGGQMRWGRSFDPDHMETLKDRQVIDTFDTPAQGLTFDDEMDFEGVSDRDARVYVEMHGAGPVTILGMVPVIETNEG